MKFDFNHNGVDDIEEIRAGFAAFAADVRAGNVNAVVKDVVDGAAWLKAEVEGMLEEAQIFFNMALKRVRDESTTLGEGVANMLTLLNNGALQQALGLGAQAIEQLKNLSSAVVEAALGLIGGFKAATAAI